MSKFHWSFEYRDVRLAQVNSIAIDESLDEVFGFSTYFLLDINLAGNCHTNEEKLRTSALYLRKSGENN